MRNPGKTKEVRSRKTNKRFLGHEKQIQKIKRKYLRLSKVLCKCNMRENPNRLSTSGETKLSTSVQASDAQRKWNLGSPVVVKLLLRSHVSGCFWMGLPVQFCKEHLPMEEDTIIVLETESAERWDTKYLPRKTALSGGWRKFALDQKLVAGDVIVFRLVEATRFKVHIIRVNTSTGASEPISSCNLDTHWKQGVSDGDQVNVYKRRKVHHPSEASSSKRINVNPRIAKDPEAEVHFENITNFEYFIIVINKLLQNHELPESVQWSYYELCCSQCAFLHANLFKGMNNIANAGTVASILSGTVKIANALRTCNLSTFLDEFALWQSTLNAYEALGMNVRFLCTRLVHLQNLAFSSEGALERKRYIEASYERVRCRDEVKKLEAILVQLRNISINAPKRYIENEVRKLEALLEELALFFDLYDAVIEDLKLKVENHEFKFQEEVSAPW